MKRFNWIRFVCSIGSNTDGYILGMGGNNNEFAIITNFTDGAQYKCKYTSTFLADNKYHHFVAVIYDRAVDNKCKLYIDSVLVAGAEDLTTINNNTAGLSVGGYFASGGAKNTSYSAAGFSIDSLAIWKSTMPTQTQIDARFKAGYGAQYIK